MSSAGLFILSAMMALQLSASSRSTASTASYNEFRKLHRKEDDGSVSYAERLKLFEARSAEVAAHNKQGKSWKLAMNHFADYTDAERQAMLGYKRVGGRWAQSSDTSSMLQTGATEVDFGHIDVAALAKTVDWRKKMNFSNFVHNQGACGSCWAHAAVAALEAHAELSTGKQMKLATQEIIDCTANPMECGGTGGCHGATSEMAFENARVNGISLLSDYTGARGKCAQNSPSALQVTTFVRLPENKGSYLQYALAEKGPTVMSVDANKLFMYGNGVFAGCSQDTVVNHAVLGVGYGSDSQTSKDYWLIKNSWGEGWGEKGYIRLERFSDDNAYCGNDDKPQEGVYCKNGPASIRVCGMCGGTSDSTYPLVSAAEKKSLRQAARPALSKVAGHQNLLSVF